MPNLAALCAAVFPLSARNLRGGGNQPPPCSARVNIESPKIRDIRFVGSVTLTNFWRCHLQLHRGNFGVSSNFSGGWSL